MSSERSKQYGGRPGRLPLRLYQARRGLSRSYDLLKMLDLTLRGWTSVNQGGIVERFENAFEELTGAKHALAMNSGTASLHSAFFAVGVGPGTEVLLPAYTWHATATPVLLCGAVPRFCEIDPETLVVDLDDLERRITPRTRAICVLHPWGNPAPMDRVMELAERHSLSVVEDCSHAQGARYRERSVGTWGHVGCFSLQGSKALDGGEAGVAITDDPVLYDRMLLLGHNFLVGNGGLRTDAFKDFGDTSLGCKFRPHPAAMYLALGSLQRLAARNRGAARAWEILCEELSGVPGIRPIPTTPGGERAGFYAFVLEYQGEALGGPPTEEFVRRVCAGGVPMDLDQYRDALLHRTPLFRSFPRNTLGGGCYDPTRPFEEQLAREDLPVTEQIARRLVRLPPQLHGVPESYVRRCAAVVRSVLEDALPRGAKPVEPPAPAAGQAQ